MKTLLLLPVRGRRIQRLLALALAIHCTALLLAAELNTTKPFDLPAGSAALSLKQFAEQSGRGVVYVTEIVKDVRTRAVQGDLAPSAALREMLAGTVLVAEEDPKTGAFAVRKGAADPNAPRAAPSARSDRPNQIPTSADEVMVLSPFEVSASSDVGYQARETIAGGRLRTDLKDVSAQVDVMTQEFISDLGLNTLEEAFKYSLSVESESDFFDVTGSGTLTGNPLAPGGGNRVRGLVRATTSVGFFETSAPIDSYNTERYTFVNGPNAILFGNGMPGGSIDTSFKRAQTGRNKYSTSLQLDSDHGYRATIDLNQVLLKNLVAVRFNGLKQDQDLGRQPSFDRQERMFSSVSLDPFKALRIRAYHESGDIKKQPVRPTLVQDKVTPYLNTLSPEARARFLATYDPSVLRGFDNAAINSFSSTANNNALTAALAAQGFAPAGQVAVATRYTTTQPVIVSGGAGGPFPVISWNNTIQTSTGPGAYYGDNNDWSFSNEEIYPAHINIFGNALQNRIRSRIYGGIVEFNPVKNLFFEYGYNRESMNHRYVDYLGQGNGELMIDLNRYLPVSVASGPLPTRVPNPNFGRYYVTSSVSAGILENQREDHRATATYELDFTKRTGWARWLGTHRLLGLWTSQMNQRFNISGGAYLGRVVSDNEFTTTPVAVDINNNRSVQMRHYLGSPTAGVGGSPFVDLPYDPWNPGTVGHDGSGRPVILGGENSPIGHATRIGNGRKMTKGSMFSIQSAFLDNRIITNFGLRKDRNTYTNWIGANLQPRYDAATGQFVLPSPNAPIGAGHRLNDAPYAPWDVFENFGYDKILDHAGVKRENPTSRLKGIVIHPRRWLSFFYNDSTAAYAAEFSFTNLDGTPTPLDDGFGKDYGFSVSAFEGRISLRVNLYENTRTGATSKYRDAEVGFKSMRDIPYHVEKTFLLARPGYQPSGQYAFYTSLVQQEPVANNISAATQFTPTGTPNSPIRSTCDVNSDKYAEGTEVTLTANPLKGLFVALRGAKNRTVEKDIGLGWFEYIASRKSEWESIADATLYNLPGQPMTIRRYFQTVMLPAMSYIKMIDGLPNPQERGLRLNLTTRYSFQRESLKGFFVGGNYNWRGKNALGYFERPATEQDVVMSFAGLGAGSFMVPDLNRVVYGNPLTSLDAFAGYRRKIFSGRYEWHVQLNIRNVLDDQELIPQRAKAFNTPTGYQAFITNYNVPDPRRFILTNTISF